MALSDARYYQHAILISFDSGAAGSLKITNLATDITIASGIGAGSYVSFPEFNYRLPERSGGFEEKPLEIEIPAINDYLDKLVTGYAFAPTTIDVYDYLFDDVNGEDPEIRHLYRGRLQTATSNYHQNHDLIKMSVMNDKGRLAMALGVSCHVQCSWVLGDDTCKATVISLGLTVATINGTVMTTTTSPDPGTYPSRLFNKGYVQKDDIRILIREWISGSLFLLAKPPPISWVGEAVTVFSGCDRSLSTCIGTYDNQLRFGGLGYRMSAHNPIYEEES